MKKILIMAALSLMLSACEKPKSEVNDAQVNRLYGELCGAYRAYTDSMSLATDSVGSAKRIEESLDAALLRIYKSYPADFDRHLSQAQNDTLWALTQRYMKQRNLRLGGRRMSADTIPADTMQLSEGI